jgi:hypothetical protein
MVQRDASSTCAHRASAPRRETMYRSISAIVFAYSADSSSTPVCVCVCVCMRACWRVCTGKADAQRILERLDPALQRHGCGLSCMPYAACTVCGVRRRGRRAATVAVSWSGCIARGGLFGAGLSGDSARTLASTSRAACSHTAVCVVWFCTDKPVAIMGGGRRMRALPVRKPARDICTAICTASKARFEHAERVELATQSWRLVYATSHAT